MKSREVRPEIIKHRLGNQGAAVIFIHGFTGNITETWGNFPSFLLQQPALNQWDIISLGYSTTLAPDLSGVWSADAPIDRLATLLRTTVSVGLPPYKALAILAHSMGGLVLQRALVDDPSFAGKVTHMFLFGTPSNGLKKASPIGFFKRQLRDMAEDGVFIGDLREKWGKAFGAATPFIFWAVAGERDEFVPSASSLDVFPRNNQAVIPGDHLSIVKPQTEDHLGLQLVVRTVVGAAAPAGPWNSARVAVESRDYHRAISMLEGHASDLDEGGVVQLALAYDSIGRAADAIKLLEDHGRNRTNAMGTLAGRLKRRWILERRKEDCDRALKLYSDALQLAQEQNLPDQVYYQAINVAFLRLATGNRQEALELARQTLEYAQHGDQLHWKLATRGEAFLILGDIESAVDAYTQALKTQPSVREIESMYKQAMWIAELQKDQKAVLALNNVFRATIQSQDAL